MANPLAFILKLTVVLVFEVRPALVHQRQRFVQELAPARNNCRAALFVIAPRTRWGCIQRIGAVKGVVEAAPARVCCIQEKARVENWHHQLGPRHCRDFSVHILSTDLEVSRLWHEVADLTQKCLVLGCIMRLAGALGVIGIDLGLQFLALFKQRLVARRVGCQ